MLGSHLAGLRGGLEAALLVGVLAAWWGAGRGGARAAGRRGVAVRGLWIGAAAAGLAALAVGWVFTYGTRELTPGALKVLGGVLSVAAAGCVTWAVLRPDGARAGAAGAAGFLVVAREGTATALFLWAAVSAARDEAGSAGPLGMVLLGLGVAALLGWGAHLGVRRLPEARLRAVAGGVLAVVTAGVLARGVRDLQDGGPLGGLLAGRAVDLGGAVAPDRWPGALLEGVFNVSPEPTVLQVAVWALYLVPALALALAPVGFGRSVPVGVEEQKRTDARAGAGGGAGPDAGPGGPRSAGGRRGGGGADTDGERLRDGPRRAGGRADGDPR
ncbi:MULTISPECIES: FTR1 family protein [Streptomyces]|uniref:Ferrous iron permease EfeU n=1 Tax=Streptomyces fradiae ATCC 10745 = DSM 40063 TaxID=1319510 RepID=A0A1Y2NWU3_STRFR|nr:MULTISPECIES: FTR1 family protein [Streptomyces]OSY52022.1 Ferrous iron permease EfeU [Streptomyces fradiae ATCC 10745 = DSM 40063]QEV15600.1 iron transporter [Streptomyces fradiae ATCC 10745 = DSM 40063]